MDKAIVKGKLVGLLVVGLTLAFIFSFRGVGGCKEKTRIGIPTGSSAGTVYGWVTGLASIMNKCVPDVQITSQVSGGSVENIELLKKGEAWSGICDAGLLKTAIEAKARYAGLPPATNLSAWLVMYPRETPILTPKGKPLKSLHDLQGKRVFIGRQGSPQPEMAKELFTKMGIWDKVTPIMGDWSYGAEQMRRGEVDAIFTVTTGWNIVGFVKEFQTFAVDWYPLKHDEMAMLMKEFPGTIPGVLNPSPSMYKGIDRPIPTLTGLMLLAARNDLLSEELSYKLIKALLDHPEEVRSVNAALAYATPENHAAASKFLPIHPGVAKYLKEKGLF